MARHGDRRRLWPVSADDKAWVVGRMEELELSRAELARAIGATTAYVTMFLDEERPLPIRSSRRWPEIVAAVGGQPPSPPDPPSVTSVANGSHADAADQERSSRLIDEDTRVILEKWSRLTPEERAAVSALVRTLTSGRS